MSMEAEVATRTLGTLWDWVVFGFAGAVVGALADHIKENALSTQRNLVIGLVGGLLGGFGGLVATWYGVGVQGSLWSFFTASVGAAALLALASLLVRGRGIDKRAG
jgi:uncharacterized membrane protein YeaQ/YmgE (transglycosylase-associated protein family)